METLKKNANRFKKQITFMKNSNTAAHPGKTVKQDNGKIFKMFKHNKVLLLKF